MICIVLECEQFEEDSRGLCAGHLRRYVEGLVYTNESGDMVDHCHNDHELVEENIRWESSGKNGKRRRRCRECLRAKARRQSKNAIKVVEVPKPYRPNDLVLTQAIRDFEEAQKHVTAKCHDNPGPWMDWDEDSVPTKAEAEALCHGCPLVKACANYAKAAQETHGVWGGNVVHEGVWLY
jgi:hypothetical protein